MADNLLFDVDGNQYNTFEIGNQIWMAENLRVKHFSNGDFILKAKNRKECEWQMRSKESAVYISSEDTSDYLKYGFLYSRDAVFDSRNLAPKGWRIPSIEDWQVLVNFLGGENEAGRKLKNEVGWKRELNKPPSYNYRSCEFNGNNESGFSALPSGRMKLFYENAFDVGMYAWYWAATQEKISERTTWFGYFTLNYYKGNVHLGCTSIDDYLAVRCIKI